MPWLQDVSISTRLISATLGQAWTHLVAQILQDGTPMADEGLELLCAETAFAINSELDPILQQLGNQKMIAEMKHVFFTEGPNSLGHSYAKLIRGPGGRNDLQDIISLLRAEPLTKRALVNFMSEPGGKVPCISAVQFLIRDGILHIIYFARGQDAFKKFYADGLCLVAMAETVAKALNIKTGAVRGMIGSSHIYHQDMTDIRKTLAAADLLSARNAQGALT